MEKDIDKELIFKRWVSDYSDIMFGYTLKRIGDYDRSKDIIQDAFLAAWRNMDRYKKEVSEKNWMFIILKSKIIDYFRMQAKQVLVYAAEGHDDVDYFFDDAGHWQEGLYPKDMRVDWQQPGETSEFYAVFRSCSKKLQKLQHAVFVMKYVDGMESHEICKTLEISSSNYWVLIHRAKLQLRACLEKNWL